MLTSPHENTDDLAAGKRLLTSREYALVIGTSESSVKRWTDSGEIRAVRTPGGHRRITAAEGLRFARGRRFPILHPELLGLEKFQIIETNENSWESLRSELAEGHQERAMSIIVGSFISGLTMAEIADQLIAPSLESIGTEWEHSDRGIFIEHRAFEICQMALRQIQSLLPEADANAPQAVGCAPGDDIYILPSLIASIVMHEAAFRSINLGVQTPITTLDYAIAEYRATLCWVSFSTSQVEKITEEIKALAKRMAKSDVKIVCGGRRIPEELKRSRSKSIVVLETMEQLYDAAMELSGGVK